jgi:hypothetical protein
MNTKTLILLGVLGAGAYYFTMPKNVLYAFGKKIGKLVKINSQTDTTINTTVLKPNGEEQINNWNKKDIVLKRF